MTERGHQWAGDEVGRETREDGESEVRIHESRPGRVVFTEAGNTDAWIASDLTVDPEP